MPNKFDIDDLRRKLDTKKKSIIADEILKELLAQTGYGVMISVCGWCGEYLGVKNGGEKHGVTTGACQSCHDALVRVNDHQKLVLTTQV